MKLESIDLKQLGEKWVQKQIADDPPLLGLGDLILKDKERMQPRAGRLDLLLQDPESLKRYETEIGLATTEAVLASTPTPASASGRCGVYHRAGRRPDPLASPPLGRPMRERSSSQTPQGGGIANFRHVSSREGRKSMFQFRHMRQPCACGARRAKLALGALGGASRVGVGALSDRWIR
jgi:hypothetical protein